LARFTLSILLNPWTTVLEKLPGSRIVQKFSAFCGTRRFVTVFAVAWTQCTTSHPALRFTVERIMLFWQARMEGFCCTLVTFLALCLLWREFC
jgi:hypothetical protein